jgi:hypothetical protein
MRNVDQMLRKVSDLRDLCLQVARLNPARRPDPAAIPGSPHPAAIPKEDHPWLSDPVVNEDPPH